VDGREHLTGQKPMARTLEQHPRLVYALTAAAFLVGLYFRLVGLADSLWLDEFGTLWAVEEDVRTVFDRVMTIHGQSPAYYLVIWGVVRLFGESELAVRLPSLLFGAGIAVVAYAIGAEVRGRAAGLLAAGLAWLAYPVIDATVNARAYALAGLMASVMLWGFVRAANGLRWGRPLFVAGGIGLFYAHYLMVFAAAGVAAGYGLVAELRRTYRPGTFALDVSVQAVAALPAAPHLLSLFGRRGELDWIRGTRATFLAQLLLPLLIPAIPAIRDALRRGWISSPASSWDRFAWIALATTVVLPALLSAVGVHLLATRYMLPVVFPIVLVAGLGLARAGEGAGLRAFALFLVFSVLIARTTYVNTGLYSLRPNQDWRMAVEVLNEETARHPDAPVLYRSGFVEDDLLDRRHMSFSLAPLRSPGRALPSWSIVPLTWSWSEAERTGYLESRVVPLVEQARTFYVLSCDCYTPYTGAYLPLVVDWVEQRFPGRFTLIPIDAGQGMQLAKFEQR
jgi:uncharacterized membrane protein